MSSSGLCKECGAPLPAYARSNQIFCSIACAKAWTSKQWRERNPKSPLGELAKGTIAEVNEMRVAIDLLQRGYEVYRAAFQGMPCDILIFDKDDKWGFGTAVRVEVTTGNYAPNGTLSHPLRNPENYDVLAVVTPTAIVYKPEL